MSPDKSAKDTHHLCKIPTRNAERATGLGETAEELVLKGGLQSHRLQTSHRMPGARGSLQECGAVWDLGVSFP